MQKYPKKTEVQERRNNIQAMLEDNPLISSKEVAEVLGIKLDTFHNDAHLLGYNKVKPKYIGKPYWVNVNSKTTEYAVKDPETGIWEPGYFTFELAVKEAQSKGKGTELGMVHYFTADVDALEVLRKLEYDAYWFADEYAENWSSSLTHNDDAVKDL